MDKKDTYSIVASIIISILISLCLPKKLEGGFKFIIIISLILIIYIIIRYAISTYKEKEILKLKKIMIIYMTTV